jgi:hypothetical protein
VPKARDIYIFSWMKRYRYVNKNVQRIEFVCGTLSVFRLYLYQNGRKDINRGSRLLNNFCRDKRKRKKFL